MSKLNKLQFGTKKTPEAPSGNELDESTGPTNPKGNGQEQSNLPAETYKKATGSFF